MPVTQTTRTRFEESEASLKRFPRRLVESAPLFHQTPLTPSSYEADDPGAARETRRREQDRNDEEPLPPP